MKGITQKSIHSQNIQKIKNVVLFTAMCACFFFIYPHIYAQSAQKTTNGSITAESFINWQTGFFSSNIMLDMKASGFTLPAGRSAAVNRIQQQLPLLIKDPLLTVLVDSSTQLGDVVSKNQMTLEELTGIIDKGTKSAGVYGRQTDTLSVTHSMQLHSLSSPLVLHKSPYAPTVPIEQISSRVYTGIIIDARGALPVHGEFVEEHGSPCLFPKIWDTTMELLYERNMSDPEVEKKTGPVSYEFSPERAYEAKRVGNDPLYISAREIFGIYRTDPVIARSDALKILSVPENRQLLRQAKVVILLDEQALVHPVAAPLKDKTYYFEYKETEDFIHENKIPDVEINDTPRGMQISVRDLKFKADSAVLLPEETKRLDLIAQALKKAAAGNEYTILVEGHTASVGKERGEKILSVQRAQTIIAEMARRGVNEKLFTYRGYGGTHPIGDNTTTEGRALNRRVEITVVPKTTYIQRLY